MNDKMSLIFITSTGHVVGAVTCNSDPQRVLTPADVATPAYLVANSDAPGLTLEFSVPASVLSVSPPMAYSDPLFQAPPGFVVSGITTGPLSLDLTGSSGKVSLSTTALTVNIAAALATDTPVFAQLVQQSSSTTPPDTRVIAGVIPSGQTSAALPLTLLPGGATDDVKSGVKYSTAVFVSGYKPYFDTLAA